jgi:hypothetical protein
MDPTKSYISKYGSFTHILIIFINEDLCETEKNTVKSAIYELLHKKQFIKNILGTDFPVTWNVANENNLLQYYSNGCVNIMSDFAIKIHTDLVLIDIEEKIGEDKFSFLVTKLLTTPISLL